MKMKTTVATPKQFASCLRIMFCMTYDTFLTLIEYEKDHYSFELFEVMKSNPAKFLCKLDDSTLNKFIKTLKGLQ